jgi:putative ABC transport system substrate-binding protein
LHEIVPAATSIAYVVDPTNPVAEAEAKEIRTAARALGVSLLTLYARDASELEAALATLVREGAGGLVVSNDSLSFRFPDRIIAFAARQKVPTIYVYREHVVAGGLASYGADHPDAWRQIGVYAGRILRGEKPADLPVQQVTKVQLSINMKTAKALGLTFPTSLLLRADEVIE